MLLEAARRSVVTKSFYIEVCAIHFDTGIIPVTYAAALTFYFDRRFQAAKAMGLRIFEDTSFHYFDIEENVRRLRKESHDAEHHATSRLEGTIVAYFADKGFGFIEEISGQKYFFHIVSVAHEELHQRLLAFNQGDTLPVHFAYGGSEGKKYPKAIEVVLRQ